jgi:hypothetical protein
MEHLPERMEKILFVAYNFPPLAGAGVARSLKLVKKLPELGINPIVLTIDEDEIKKAHLSMDQELLNEVPDNIQVVRVNTNYPYRLERILIKLRIFRLVWFLFYFPFFWERASFFPKASKNIALSLMKNENIKTVYTSSGPFSSLELGAYLKNNGFRWVADLRDPFTDAYMSSFPSKAHWMMARVWERYILNQCDVLVVNTQAVKKHFIGRGFNSELIQVVPNGI